MLEFMDRPVAGMDKKSGELLRKALEKQGMKFRFKASAKQTVLRICSTQYRACRMSASTAPPVDTIGTLGVPNEHAWTLAANSAMTGSINAEWNAWLTAKGVASRPSPRTWTSASWIAPLSPDSTV